MKKLIFFAFVFFVQFAIAQSKQNEFENAKSLYLEGKLEKALTKFSKIEKSNSKDLNAIFYFKVLILMELNRIEEAKKVCQESKDKFPETMLTHMANGRYFFHINLYDQAINEFSLASSLAPEMPHSYYYKARCFSLLEKEHEAIENYTKAIELNSSDSEYYFRRAICYVLIDEREKGCEDYKKAIELDSNITYEFEIELDCN